MVKDAADRNLCMFTLGWAARHNFFDFQMTKSSVRDSNLSYHSRFLGYLVN